MPRGGGRLDLGRSRPGFAAAQTHFAGRYTPPPPRARARGQVGADGQSCGTPPRRSIARRARHRRADGTPADALLHAGRDGTTGSPIRIRQRGRRRPRAPRPADPQRRRRTSSTGRHYLQLARLGLASTATSRLPAAARATPAAPPGHRRRQRPDRAAEVAARRGSASIDGRGRFHQIATLEAGGGRASAARRPLRARRLRTDPTCVAAGFQVLGSSACASTSAPPFAPAKTGRSCGRRGRAARRGADHAGGDRFHADARLRDPVGSPARRGREG